MALEKLATTADEHFDVSINNGDCVALKKIVDIYGLKDETSVIAFAIGILSQSNGQGVSVTKENGVVVRLIPSDDLKK